MELPKRKQLRLQEYDYSQNGAYFVTICTHNKECILGDIKTNTDFVGDGVTHRQRSGGHCRWLCLQNDEQDIPFVAPSKYGKVEVTNVELPKRKQLRLQEYDYSQNGAYFVTICTHNKECILGDIKTNTDFVGDGVLDIPFVAPSKYGKIVEQTLQDMVNTYDDLDISKYIIMPNHIHMIIHMEQQSDNGLSRTPTPTRANQRIPSLVSTLKRFSNKKCGKSIWQRGYHDHVIRNQTSYEEIWQYIDTNPLKWELDKYHMES